MKQAQRCLRRDTVLRLIVRGQGEEVIHALFLPQTTRQMQCRDITLTYCHLSQLYGTFFYRNRKLGNNEQQY